LFLNVALRTGGCVVAGGMTEADITSFRKSDKFAASSPFARLKSRLDNRQTFAVAVATSSGKVPKRRTKGVALSDIWAGDSTSSTKSHDSSPTTLLNLATQTCQPNNVSVAGVNVFPERWLAPRAVHFIAA